MFTLAAVDPVHVAAWIAAGVGLFTLLGLLWAGGKKVDQMTDAYTYVRRQMSSNGGVVTGTEGKGLREAVDTGVTLTSGLVDRLKGVADGIDEVKAEQAALRLALVNAIHRDDQRLETVDRRLDDQDMENRRLREVLRDHTHGDLAESVNDLRKEMREGFAAVEREIGALYERTEKPE